MTAQVSRQKCLSENGGLDRKKTQQRTEDMRWDAEKFRIGTPLALGAAVGAKSHTDSQQPVRFKALDRTLLHLQSCVSTRADSSSVGARQGAEGPRLHDRGRRGEHAGGISLARWTLACQQLHVLCDHSRPHPRRPCPQD